MPSLRKKPVPAAVEPETVEKLNGKGRATPTRKEAQASRRSGASTRRAVDAGPAPSRATRRPRAVAMREARREKAAEYRKAMASGDVSKLPARERVPERIMARDIVDQRRNLGPLLLGVDRGRLLPRPGAGRGALKVVAFYLLPLCLIGIVGRQHLRRRARSTRQVREKYPNTTVKVKGYVGQRALMPARWRQPRPRPGHQGRPLDPARLVSR